MIENIDEIQNSEYYLPFNINSDCCKELIGKKMKLLTLTPFSLKKEAVFKTEKRFFLPVEITDFYVSGEVMLDANNVLREWKEKKEKCKEVNNYEVKYNCFIPYENVLVLQNNSYFKEKEFSNLEPFNVELLQESNEEDVEKLEDNYTLESINNMKKKIFKDSIKFIKNNDTYQEKRVKTHSLEIQDINKKKLFLPIWIYNFNYNNNEYFIYVNGQTGKIVGEFPKSKIKLVVFSSVTFIVIFVLAFLISYFL